MNIVSQEIPDTVWKLTEQVRMRSTLEEFLRKGRSNEVLKLVAAQGEAQAAILNERRDTSTTPPYAFQALLVAYNRKDEGECYFFALQRLYQALVDTFGPPVLISKDS